MISAKITLKINKDAYPNIEQRLEEGLDDLADAIFEKSQELVPVDEGMLKKSGYVQHGKLERDIGYTAPHALWIEFGTDPHPVSKEGREQITKWAMRVLSLNRKQAENAAEKIIWKIRRYGSEPQPYLRPAFDEGVARAKEIFEQRFK